jgi:UDP-glucose 4-epimerase
LEIAKYLSNNFEFLPSRPGEPQITHANIEKARSLLKWNPTIDIETGISEMLLGIESWRDAPLWDIDSITSSTQLWFKYLGDSS